MAEIAPSPLSPPCSNDDEIHQPQAPSAKASSGNSSSDKQSDVIAAELQTQRSSEAAPTAESSKPQGECLSPDPPLLHHHHHHDHPDCPDHPEHPVQTSSSAQEPQAQPQPQPQVPGQEASPREEESTMAVTTASKIGTGSVTTSFLEDLLICSLCHERMRQPSSLACGHSFCRPCLISALRHRKECPMCRATCYTVADPRPNVVLAALIREAFPEDVDSCRRDGLSEGLTQNGEDAGLRLLPLFLASSVQVPQAKCSMHLFEPRYRILTQRALDGGGDFAMVWARDGLAFPVMVEPASLVNVAACIVHIDVARPTADGRWNLGCSGVRRARIKECWVEEGTHGLYMARLEVLEEDGASTSSSAPAVAEVTAPEVPTAIGSQGRVRALPLPPDLGPSRRDRLDFIESAMETLGVKPPVSRASHSSSSSSSSSPEAVQTRSEDATVWSAAASMGGPPYGWATDEELQALLEKDSMDERIELLCSMLFKACRERWSVTGFASRCMRRWGPVVVAVLAAYAVSAARTSLSEGQTQP